MEVYDFREDDFARNMYDERKKSVTQKKEAALEYQKRKDEMDKLAKDDAAERETLALRLDAEMKHRMALEQQYREQEEMSRDLAEKQGEEKRQLLQRLAELENAVSAAAKQNNRQEAQRLEQEQRKQADELDRKQAKEQADLSRSVMELRQRRVAQDGAIDSQLEMQLARSRVGQLRGSNPHIPLPIAYAPDSPEPSNQYLAPPGGPPAGAPQAAPRSSPDPLDKSSADLSSSTALLSSYSTAAFKSLSSWYSQAQGLVGKLVWSTSADAQLKLGRPKCNLISASYVDISAPTTVRKVIPLPKYQHLTQGTTKITPEELNKNAEYFYRFREPMVVSQINHPHILRFSAPLVTPDQSILLESPMLKYDLAFFSAEMLTGDADSVLETIRTITAHVLLAIHYLHSLSLYHLNLKPTSVLIHQSHPAEPVIALLTSFAKARARGSHDSFVATLDLSDLPYSLPYMSPQFAEVAESVISGTPSPRIDWIAVDNWSVGCLLASMLARGCDLFSGVRSARELRERAMSLNRDALHRFIATSMRRRKRAGLPDLATAKQFESAVRLAAQLLQYDPTQRIGTLEALNSPFISLQEDIVSPRVQEPFDDEALPLFALRHRGVPQRSEIIHPGD